MKVKHRRHFVIACMILTAAVTVACFMFSHVPGKRYLNPLYVDVVVTIAGLLLVIDAHADIARGRFVSVIFRSVTGTAIISIHVMQFIYDIFITGRA